MIILALEYTIGITLKFLKFPHIGQISSSVIRPSPFFNFNPSKSVCRLLNYLEVALFPKINCRLLANDKTDGDYNIYNTSGFLDALSIC